jgi:putative endonuclease
MRDSAFVYILTNRRFGTLYTGVTSDLIKRVCEHKSDLVEGFTKTHQTHLLVWFEPHGSIVEAITREKRIKKWHRDWKVNLIQSDNPQWNDLYEKIAI